MTLVSFFLLHFFCVLFVGFMLLLFVAHMCVVKYVYFVCDYMLILQFFYIYIAFRVLSSKKETTEQEEIYFY